MPTLPSRVVRGRVYNLLVPGFLRRRIYDANVREYRAAELARAAARESRGDGANLSPAYISHLRVVLDRDALFRSLPGNAVVAQVGFGDGVSANRILQIARPSKLYLCESLSDLNPQGDLDVLRAQLSAQLASGQLEIRSGLGQPAIQSLAPRSLDWVYLEHCGNAQDLVATLVSCRERLNQGGIIAGRDYGTRPHAEADECIVVTAVHDFCKEFGWEMILLTHEYHRQLNYAIRRIAGQDVAE